MASTSKEKTTASSTTSRSKNETQPRNHQRSKIHQPKYSSPKARKRQPQQVWVPKTMMEARSLSNGNQLRWVERQATKQSPKPRSLKKSTLPHATTRWVLKTLLQAQGYYKGSTQLWLPKKRSATASPSKAISTQSAKLKSDIDTPQSTNRNTYQWRPIIKKRMEHTPKATDEAKQSLQIWANKMVAHKSRPSIADKGKWVPKQHCDKQKAPLPTNIIDHRPPLLMDIITPLQQKLHQLLDELPRESPSVQLTPTATLSNKMIQSIPKETITNVPSLPQQDQDAFTIDKNITKKPMFYF